MKLWLYIVLLTIFLILGLIIVIYFHEFYILAILYILVGILYFGRIKQICYLATNVTQMLYYKRKDNFYCSKLTRELFGNNGMYKVKFVGHSVPNTPVIFVANYPNEFIEYTYYTVVQRNAKNPITMVTKDLNKLSLPSRKIFSALFCDKNHISIPEMSSGSENGGNFEKTKRDVEKHIYSYGRSVWAYPERGGSTKKIYSTQTLRQGFFAIAEQLSVPVVPIVCSHICASSWK